MLLPCPPSTLTIVPLMKLARSDPMKTTTGFLRECYRTKLLRNVGNSNKNEQLLIRENSGARGRARDAEKDPNLVCFHQLRLNFRNQIHTLFCENLWVPKHAETPPESTPDVRRSPWIDGDAAKFHLLLGKPDNHCWIPSEIAFNSKNFPTKVHRLRLNSFSRMEIWFRCSRKITSEGPLLRLPFLSSRSS